MLQTCSPAGLNFKHHSVICNDQIQFVLYFPSPEEFKLFVDKKAEEMAARWKLFDGIENW